MAAKSKAVKEYNEFLVEGDDRHFQLRFDDTCTNTLHIPNELLEYFYDGLSQRRDALLKRKSYAGEWTLDFRALGVTEKRYMEVIVRFLKAHQMNEMGGHAVNRKKAKERPSKCPEWAIEFFNEVPRVIRHGAFGYASGLGIYAFFQYEFAYRLTHACRQKENEERDKFLKSVTDGTFEPMELPY